jgi:Co/Zn/Cd efflux system component
MPAAADGRTPITSAKASGAAAMRDRDLSRRVARTAASVRSVWICSRNDALGNAAVLLAAMGVFGTGTGWPDVIVAAIMGGLGLWGGWQIVHQARAELYTERRAHPAMAAE